MPGSVTKPDVARKSQPRANGVAPLGEALEDGERLAEGERLGLAELEGDTEGLVLLLGETEDDGETLGLTEDEGDSDEEGLREALALADGDTEADGDWLALGLTEALGLEVLKVSVSLSCTDGLLSVVTPSV